MVPFLAYVTGDWGTIATKSKTFLVKCRLFPFRKGKVYVKMGTLSKLAFGCSVFFWMFAAEDWLKVGSWQCIVSCFWNNSFYISRIWITEPICEFTCVIFHVMVTNVIQKPYCEFSKNSLSTTTCVVKNYSFSVA